MSLGQDTEFFCFDTKQNRAVPAHTIGIQKEKTAVGWDGSYFRDGYAIEINGHAHGCRAGMWESMARTLKIMKEGGEKWDYRQGKDVTFPGVIPKHIQLITTPCVDVDLQEIKDGPDDLKVFGCHPTYDAYARRKKEVTVDPMEVPFRTTGGHLHWSFDKSSQGSRRRTLDELAILAKYCDLLIGLPFTVIYGDDPEFRRRTLYGQAGEFREQEYGRGLYGLEYRTLSSRLYNHPAIFGLFSGVFKYMMEKCDLVAAAGWNDALDQPLQRAINTGEGSTALLEEFHKHMKKWTKVDESGMNGLGYIPKHWGDAILKLQQMRKEKDILDHFQMWEGQLQAHYGWSEYNDGVTNRRSTVDHQQFIKEEPWLL